MPCTGAVACVARPSLPAFRPPPGDGQRSPTDAMYQLAILLVIAVLSGCGSRNMNQHASTDGDDASRSMPCITSMSRTSGDITVHLLQLSERRISSENLSYLDLMFVLEYSGPEDVGNINTTTPVYRQVDGKDALPEGPTVSSYSRSVPLEDFDPPPFVDLPSVDGYGLVMIKTVPGHVPRNTIAILVDFGINEDSATFSFPIRWVDSGEPSDAPESASRAF
ncbi:hypothetical protein SAMN06265222_1444 [Neorhodopirellula lusitana]|nr:hypothetical protein SAMN06265222_1444 [Neorhodopirellula lusitana]